jgi:hypothetical protein
MAAMTIIAETGWSVEYTMNQTIDMVVALYLTIQRRAVQFAGLGMGGLVGASADTGSRPAKPRRGKAQPTVAQGAPAKGDKYSTRTWEEPLGGKRVRVHNRINIVDLWDDPSLLQKAVSGQE